MIRNIFNSNLRNLKVVQRPAGGSMTMQKGYEEPDPEDGKKYKKDILYRLIKPEADTMIIFVHGLGGSRFGDGSTFGKFPTFIEEEFRGRVSIAMHSYNTLWDRFGISKTAGLPVQAEMLAGAMRDDIKDHERIILITHSMGGILALGAISSLATRGNDPTLSKIKGLFLMAVPQLGSRKVPWLARLISKDARALYPHNNYLVNIHKDFANHIDYFVDRTIVCEDGNTLVKIPTFVVTAGGDRWVDRLSAGVWVPSNQKKTVMGHHTSLVKPDHNKSDAYSFVRDAIRNYIVTDPSPNEN